MPDETMKRLLVRLGVDRQDFDKAVKAIRAELQALRTGEKTAQTQKQSFLKSTQDAEKKHLDIAKQLTKATQDQVAAIQKEKAAVESLNKSGNVQLDLQKSRLQLVKQEVEQSAILITNLEKELAIERTRISLEEARFRAQMTGVRGNISQQGTGGVISSVRSTGKMAQVTTPGLAGQAAKTIAEQRQELEIERQVVATLEGELRIQRSLYEAKKLILTSLKSEVTRETEKLNLLERQLVIQKELQRRGAAIAPVAAGQTIPVGTTGATSTELKVAMAAERERAARERMAQLSVSPQNVSQLQQQVMLATQLAGISRSEAVERLKTLGIQRQVLQTQQAELKAEASRGQYTKAEVANVQAELAQRIKNLNVEEQQLRLSRARSGESPFSRLGDTIHGVMQRGIGALLGVGGGSGATGGGGGPFSGMGQIAGGMVVGGISLGAINELIGMVGKLKNALIEASGPSQQFEKEFERLASMKGIDSSDMLQKMRAATRGLVEDADLMKMANGFLRQSMSVTSDQVVRLIGNTMDLGRATGISADKIQRDLSYAFLNPQRGMMILARDTGINIDQLRQKMVGLARDTSPAERATIMMTSVLEAEEKMLLRVGRPATTLPELFKQMSIVQKNFISDIATSALGAGNLADAINKASTMIAAAMPRLREIAAIIGKDLGTAIRFVIDHFSELKRGLEVLMALQVANWLFATRSGLSQVITGYQTWGLAINGVTKKLLELIAVKKVADVTAGGGVGWQTARSAIGIGAAGATGAEAAAVTGVAAGVGGLATAGIALAAIAAVIGEIYLTMKAVNLSFSDLGAAAREIGREISEELPKAWNGFKRAALDTWKSIEDVAKPVINHWADELGIHLPSLWDTVKAKGTAAWNAIGESAKIALLSSPEGVLAVFAKYLAEKGKRKEEPIRQEAVRQELIGKGVEVGKTIEMPAFTPDSLKKLGMGQAELDRFLDTYKTVQAYIGKSPIELAVTGKKSAAEILHILETVETLKARLQPSTGKPGGDETEENRILQMELMRMNAKFYQLEAKGKLEQEKETIRENLDLWKKRYQMGLVDEADYVAKQKELRGDEATNTIKILEGERKARIADIKAQADISHQDPKRTAAEIKQVNEEFRQTEVAAEHQYALQLDAIDESYLQDKIAARRAYQSEVLKMSKAQVQEEQKDLEERFKEGQVSGNDYITQKADLIEQEHQQTQKELALEKQDVTKSARELAAIDIQMKEDEAARIRELMGLYRTADETRLKSLENAYNRIKAIYTAQQEIAQAGIASFQPGSREAEISGMERMKDINEEYLRLLTEQFKASGDNLEAQSKIATEIGKVTKEQVQLNVNLAKAKDLGIPLAGLFGTIASELGGVLPKQWTGFFQQLQHSLETLSKVKEGLAAQTGGIGGLFKGVLGGVTSPAGQIAKTMADEFKAGLKDAAGNTVEFGTYLRDAGKGTSTAMSAMDKTVDALRLQMDNLKKSVKEIADSFDGLGQALGTGTTPTDTGTTPTDTGWPTTGGTDTNIGDASSPESATIDQIMSGFSGDQSNQQAVGFDSAGKTGLTGAMLALKESIDKLTNVTVKASGEGTATGSPDDKKQGGGGLIGSLVGQFKNLFGGGKKGEGGGGFGGTVSAAVGIMQTGIQIAGSVIGVGQQLMGAQSTAGGAFQGLISGTMMGMQLGGPIGAAVGAIAGTVFGAIMGHKNAEIKKQVEMIMDALASIKDAVNNGTLGLGQALQETLMIRQKASGQGATTSWISSIIGPAAAGVSMDKVQAAAWKKLKPEIDKQIQELEAQIQKVLKDLHDSLEIITQPQAFQPFLSSLQQITTQYKQFADAAVGNAQEVANANLWLQKSLQGYLDQLGTQMNDAQQQAIQNAIQLIDLQQQQLQLDQQHAQSVYDVLTRGVLTQQRPTAMTKGAEIEGLDEQYNLQKQQNQEQTQLAQYRYNMEQKIFGLSNNRVDLEKQLLQVQEQQVNTQLKSIVAMMQVMATVQEMVAKGTSLDTSGMTSMMDQLLALLGLPTLGTQQGQRAATVSDVPKQWQVYIEELQAGPMPNILNLLQQAETDAGMRAYLAAAFNSNNIVDWLHLSGAPLGDNWRAFLKWVQAGAPGMPPPPSYAVGSTFVPATGMATVHQGESIFPQGVFQRFTDSVLSLIPSIQRLTTQPKGQLTSKAMSEINQLSAHQEMYDLATMRIGMEHDLLTAQRQQSQTEMARMAQMSELLLQMSRIGNYGQVSMEGGLAKIYELRGRYGSAGFRRESL